MARQLTEREKKILEQIGSTEEAQRSRQIVELYRNRDEANKAFSEAQKKVSTGTSMKNFNSENEDLLRKKKEADAAVAAFEQSNADRRFRQRASRLTMQQFEKEFADIEMQKQQLEKEKGSLRDALKPGGITPSEWWDNRKEKNAEIKALESKEGKYRAVYDEKKSREMTDNLPEDVRRLLDEYNSYGDIAKANRNYSVFAPETTAMYGNEAYEATKKQKEVARKLVEKGYNNIGELAEYRKYITESESTDKFTEAMGEITEEHPVASTALNLALMPARIITGAQGHLSANDNQTDLRLNPKDSSYALTRANKEKRETIGEGFEDGVLKASTKKFLYETADSALESLAAGTLFGPAGGAMLGLNAMNESVIDSLESGATNEQAFVNGIAAGVFEGIFESVSLGNLRALKEVPVKTIKDAIKNIGKSVLVNFSEEANTELANLMFDYLYNGGASQYYEAVTALIGQGYSEKEARNRVILDMAKQVGMAGLGGALMGGTFGSYGSAAGAVNYNSQLKDTGRQIIESGNTEQLVAGAKDVQSNDKLRALAEEIVLNEQAQRKAELQGEIADAKDAVSDAEAFRTEKRTEYKRATGQAAVVAAKVYKTAAKDVKAKKAELRFLQKEDSKIYSKKDYKNVGKLSEMLLEQTFADTDALVKKAVSERLEKVGESNAVVADAIVKKSKGEQLTKKEQNAYNSSKKALQVYRELVGDTYDAAWARNLNKEVSELVDRRYNATVPSERATEEASAPKSEKYEQRVEDYKGQLKEALHRDGQDKEVLDAAVDLCFEYGRNGSYTLQEAIGSEHISGRIAPEQRQHAYEAGVYQGVKDTANVRYKGDAVTVFVDGFRGKDNNARRSYTSAFDVFYSEGLHTEKSFDEVMKENTSLLRFIDRSVAEKAFNVGRKQADKAEPSAPSRKKPTVKGEYNSKTVEEKEVDVFFEGLAKKLGVNITRVQSLTSGNRKANAYIDLGKGEIVSSASSDNEYQSTIHEVVHYGYAYNSPKMRPIAKAVKEYFIGKHSAAGLEEILLQYEKQYGADRAAAEEEFVAECLAGMFSTDEGVNDFLAWLENESGYNAQEKKTVLQRLADWILEIVDAINELIQGGSLNDVVADFAKEETDRLKDIRKMFLEALDEVVDGSAGGETKNTAEGGVKYSNKRLTNGSKKGYNKNSTYDEFTSNGMQWAYSASTKIGDNKEFYNPKSKKFVLIEATKNDVGFIELTSITAKERRKRLEQIRRENNSFHGSVDAFRTDGRGDSINSLLSANNGISRENGRLLGEKIPESNKSGDLERGGQNSQGAQDSEIKTSLDWIDFAEEKAKERSLASEVTELKKMVEELRGKIQHPGVKHVVNKLAVQKVARSLKSGYMSKINLQVLTDELFTFYGYMANENGLSWDNVQIYLESIATKILDESKFKNPDVSEYAKDVLRDIRGVKIKLNEKQKNAVAEKYGSYNEFRKRMMGTLVLSEEGTSLDERWQELADDYPYLFDIETSDVNQPLELVEIISALRQTYEDSYGMDYDSAKDMLMAEIYEQYFEVPETKYISEEYAVKLAGMKAHYNEQVRELKAEFKRQKEEAYKKLREKYYLRAPEQHDALKALVWYEMRMQKTENTRLKEKKRNRLIRTLKRLDRYLRSPGKGAPSAGTNKYGQDYVHLTNIPEEFKKAVIDFCYIFIEHDAGVFTGKHKDSEGVARKKIGEIYDQYQSLKESKTYMSTVVDDDIKMKIRQAEKILADKRITQLTAAELDILIEISDHLITVINNEVVMWVNGKKEKVNENGRAALKEQKAKAIKGSRPVLNLIDKVSVMNLKPIYFFEKIGGTLERLWNDILGSQDKYVRNMQFAQQRFNEIAKKHHLDKWVDDKAKTFTTAQGHEISLTRGQALLVWATWKREGKDNKDSKHLFEGGIVYPDAVEKASGKGKVELPKVLRKVYEDGTAHRIRVEDMLKIDEWLTEEQKAYADELVDLLSNEIAGWGNEISMQLYGINKFNEKYYIPFNSAGNYLYKGIGDDGTKLIKNEGFTKERQWGANNPLVVDDITKVVVKHIERMSMYNSMVIPLDNFSRVWNYQEKANAESNDSTQDVKAAFESAWGKEAAKYVNDLLRDINGGVMNDSRELGNEWISKFKKSAVMASASVMIQQPSAIGRAFSEINPMYFTNGFGKNMLPKVYEECKKYAPVAVLKEIGGFDTISGQGMTDWMLKREYKGKDKIAAFFKDSQFRDDIISYGPAWADRVTWAHIWLACKNEVKHKGYGGKKGLTGEALLEAAGKRFTEVINKTQVYDSVLSRSGIMRSSNTLAKMQTAFMAEPTTSLNMLMSAMSDFKTPKKRKSGAKKIAAVATAQVINSMLVSLVYAGRDDDEEKDYWEVWLGESIVNFFDGMNPITMVPFVKDIFSIFQGYSIERSDMTMFSNFVDSITAWKSEKKTLAEKITGTVGSVADVFGIPLKNLMRDIKAVVNVYKKRQNASDFSWTGVRVELRDKSFPFLKSAGVIDNSKDKRIYEAFIGGNENLYNEYASQYKTGGAIKSALKGQIEEGYLEGKLSEDEATAQFRRLGYSENEAYYEVRKLKEPVAEEESEDKNAAFKSFSEMQNVQSESDAELEQKKQEASDEGKEYSEDADYTWLRDKLKSGDKDAIEEEISLLKEKGVSDSKISGEVKKWLKENDSDVKRQAEQSLKGNYSGYESAVKRIAGKYGVDESTVGSAIRGAAGSNADPVDGTVYSLGDLHFAIESGNSDTVKSITDKLVEAKAQIKLNEGEDNDDAYDSARNSVRSSVRSKWKEPYQKAKTGAEMAQIRRQMWATGLWKSSYELDDLLKGWREEK